MQYQYRLAAMRAPEQLEASPPVVLVAGFVAASWFKSVNAVGHFLEKIQALRRCSPAQWQGGFAHGVVGVFAWKNEIA
jgi:hypothetical protein